MVNIGNEWDCLLKDEFTKDYYRRLRSFLVSEYKTQRIHPDAADIFNALKHTSYSDVKAVIIGQDPYHGPSQAHGLSFSVCDGIAVPPSLQNIYKELKNDLDIDPPSSGNLSKWAKNGVLLLNTILTVREFSPQSHRGKGWEILTDRIISLLNERETPVVFILWGKNAKEKAALITEKRHLILTAAHPSPLSAYSGFFGCRHFSKTNAFLKENGISEIDWHL